MRQNSSHSAVTVLENSSRLLGVARDVGAEEGEGVLEGEADGEGKSESSKERDGDADEGE